MPAARDHPAVAAWTPEPPPPPGRRATPGLVAALIALLLVFGSIGLVAARQTGQTSSGASSPSGAAGGLLAALDRDPLDAAALGRAARYLTGEERLLVTTETDRVVALANQASTGGQGVLGPFALGARDVGFRQVGGADGVAVLEAVSGTISASSGGGRLQLTVDQARQRLAEQTKGAVTSLRVVTVRSGGRWYVSLLSSALEWARLAARGGAPAYGELTRPAVAGAPAPRAAAQGLLDSLADPSARIAERLVPEERNAFDAYLPSAVGGASTGDLQRLLGRHGVTLRAATLEGRTEPVADGVVKVYLRGQDPGSAVLVLERGGTWYPSMVFTVIDFTLTTAEREHS